MFVCKECGNKRCPKATNCALDCTQSNEPGQLGSSYDFPNDVMDVTGRDVFNLVYTANMARQFNVYNLLIQTLVIQAATSANVDIKVLYGSLAQRKRAGNIPSYKEHYDSTLNYLQGVVSGKFKDFLTTLSETPYHDRITKLTNEIIPFRELLAGEVYSVNRHRFIHMASRAVENYKNRNCALPCITSLTHNISASAQKVYREGVESVLDRRICGQARLPIKELSDICARNTMN
jgi:hypothetical protein